MVRVTGAAGCPCPVMPVLCLLLDGSWVEARDARARLSLRHEAALMLSPSQLYAVTGADAWVIACPQCRAVYMGDRDAPTPADSDLLALDIDEAGAVWPVLDDAAGGP